MLVPRMLVAVCVSSLLGCAGLVPPASYSEADPSPAGETAAAVDGHSEDSIEILGADPEQAWVSPRFDTADGPLEAGTAFVCQIDPDQPPLLLTAHHLFGEAGGLPREYLWSELNALVKGARGIRGSGTVTLVAGPPLTIEGAEAMSDTSVGNDLAAFPLRAPTRTHALPLAVTEPAVGDAVWLIGPTMGDRSLRHRAVVAELGEDYMIYVFDDPVELRSTSGAPVINAADEVVAVNLGGGAESGETYGVGNPASSIRRHIRAAKP